MIWLGLSKQIHLHSIDTSSFYDEEEMKIHQKMLKLYVLRGKCKKKDNLDWKVKSINRVLKKLKTELVEELDKKSKTGLVRKLRQDAVRDKNVISMFDGATTRALNLKINQLTSDLFIVNVYFFQVFENIMKNGFTFNDEKYIFFCSSAGQIRTKKSVFIKKSLFDKVEGELTCGLSIKEINQKGGCNPNKYLAYFSLSNSATDVWEDFDIDKAIVVDDFETDVFGSVDFIDDATYEIERKTMDVLVPHMDGCGIMLDSGTRMIRAPWVKGLLVEFPFDRFIKEKCNGEAEIKDIYGKTYKVIEEDIRYILTKSQFKMAKYYDSWDDYKARFKANNCKVCYCNPEEQYIPNARLNYQFIQSLTDMKDREIDKLIKPTVQDIEKIGSDLQTSMRLLGATEHQKNPNYMQTALMKYPELMRDKYNREILKETKKSLIRQAKSGKVRVNGGYRFLSPDLYAFCEWLFLGVEKPNGLLEDGEVYCKGFRDGDELACLRSPHLYREWPIKTNKRNEEIDRWFGNTQCIYTSSHDLITKVVMADCDGDRLLVIRDSNLVKTARRNMQDIVPLYYDMKKARSVELSSDVIYNGLITAYSTGNIGPYSNNISKVWNSGHVGKQELNVIKWLCMENNQCIDFAKTLYMSERPKYIDEIIKSYTRAKLPNFFTYAKNKTQSQVENSADSTMCKIANKIPTGKITYCETLKPFDHSVLMSREHQITPSDKKQIVDCYDYWSKRRNSLFNQIGDEYRNEEDLYVFQEIRRRIIDEIDRPIDYIVDALVDFLYAERKTSKKQVLWASFGDTINKNIDTNLIGINPYCPICGSRFTPLADNQICCSKKCSEELNRQKQFCRNQK